MKNKIKPILEFIDQNNNLLIYAIQNRDIASFKFLAGYNLRANKDIEHIFEIVVYNNDYDMFKELLYKVDNNINDEIFWNIINSKNDDIIELMLKKINCDNHMYYYIDYILAHEEWDKIDIVIKLHKTKYTLNILTWVIENNKEEEFHRHIDI